MSRIVKIKGLILGFAIIAFSFSTQAQSLEEAQLAYNAGVTAKNEGNIEEAISQFEACIKASEVILTQGDDEVVEGLLSTVTAVVPGLYLKLGSDQILANKINEGLVSLNKTIEVAESYGDTDSKDKAEKLITQVHYKVGGSKYKAGDLDAALVEFDKALAMDSNFVAAYYIKAVVYKKQDNDELLKATALKGIEVAKANNDKKNQEKIEKLAKGHFLKKGNDAKGASKYDEAIINLNNALEFDANDATALYLLSSTYLAKGDNSNAIEIGEKAIASEEGGAEAQAKIYMVIAEAQVNNGDASGACASYKKAAVGQYSEIANYKIQQELKCE
jgi:tetratricopeptide (TPR) repeat protein